MLASSYLKVNEQSKLDFHYVLDRYLHFLKKKEYKNILDVGCGSGHNISESLLPMLSKSCKKIIGVDISKDMVNYAKAHNKNDPRIDFFEMDIVTDHIPKDVKNEFDFITSFYCFQFVADHKKAFQNIYEMLRPGGEVFVSFLSRGHWLGADVHLENNKQFEDFVKGVKENALVYKPSKKDLEKNLLDIGFEINYCHVKERNYVYDKDAFIGIMKSITTFNIPCPINDFVTVIIDRMNAHNLINVDNGVEYVNFPYSLLILYAKKPL